jgi:hypothetical protein
MAMPCKMCNILNTMPRGRDLEALVKALHEIEPRKQHIANVLTRNGYPISEKSVRRHIRHQTKEDN